MIKINQSNTSSTYKSDVGTKILVGSRPEGGNLVTSLVVTVKQYDDLATAQSEETDVIFTFKAAHADGVVVSQNTIDEALHYISTYGISGISEILDGPIELSMDDRVTA
jgi:hypothetical protein